MLQAKGYEVPSYTSYKPPSVPEAEPFPYGWRYVTQKSPTGEDIYEQIPLTAEDLLNPQLGDQVPQRDEHFQAILDLAGCLKTHYAKDSTTGVFSDLIMDWGVPGLPKPAPDIAVVPHLKHKQIGRSSFKVVTEGTRPSLVIEVMSPNNPWDDAKKIEIYAKAGIPEYFLIKPQTELGVPYYELFGYRLGAGVYQPLAPDDQGRLLSQTLQLWFGVEDHGRQLRVTDARTGLRLLRPAELEEARLAAEAHAQALETRLRELEALLKSRT